MTEHHESHDNPRMFVVIDVPGLKLNLFCIRCMDKNAPLPKDRDMVACLCGYHIEELMEDTWG